MVGQMYRGTATAMARLTILRRKTSVVFSAECVLPGESRAWKKQLRIVGYGKCKDATR